MTELAPGEFKQLADVGQQICQEGSVVSMIWDGKDAQGKDDSSSGTAFLVATANDSNTRTGYFLSCAHNIEDDQKGFRVRFQHFMEDYPLELLFKDTERDVLLFRVKNIPEGRILPFSSDLVKPEARVVAIGFSPFHIPDTEFRGVINAPTIIPSTIISQPFQDTKFTSILKTLGTCETIRGNSGCPIVTLDRKVMGLVMTADGTSREIITLETVLLSLQKHLHELCKGKGKGKNVVSGHAIADLLQSIVEEHQSPPDPQGSAPNPQ